MIFAGVDGCAGGWFLMVNKHGKYHFAMYSSFAELMEKSRYIHRIFVDMPIGLSSLNHPRTIDTIARKNLQGRASTIFNTPCREAVYAKTYTEAKQKNLALEGKSLSVQSYNIADKIKGISKNSVASKFSEFFRCKNNF